jgi:hypothetical protein
MKPRPGGLKTLGYSSNCEVSASIGFTANHFYERFIHPESKGLSDAIDRSIMEYICCDWRKRYWVRDPHLSARRLPA